MQPFLECLYYRSDYRSDGDTLSSRHHPKHCGSPAVTEQLDFLPALSAKSHGPYCVAAEPYEPHYIAAGPYRPCYIATEPLGLIGQ